MEEKFCINIAHLYPDILNIYGDAGNVFTLKKRLEWRNIGVSVDNITLNNNIDFNKYDIYFIGGCYEQITEPLVNELQKNKNNFNEIAQKGKVILGVCGGYQLSGKYYKNKNGEDVQGLGLLNAYTIIEDKRLTGNVTVETNFLTPSTLVGFENHSGHTYLENNNEALGKIIIGHGNNLKDKTEGARYNNVFGTYLHGSLLPKNPAFCDYLLELAIRLKLNDNNYVLEKLNDEIEVLTHNNLVKMPY